MQVVFGLSPAVSTQFTPEMCVAVQNRKKILTPYYKSSKKLVTSACYCRLWPLCMSIHVRPSNSGKITTFRDVAYTCFSSRKILSLTGTAFCHKKTSVLVAAHGEDFVILPDHHFSFILAQF